MPDSHALLVDLLRHGEVAGRECFRGSTDEPLSSNGWQQMQRAVALNAPWQRLLSSPLRRCAEFAEQLANDSDIPLSINPELREIHFGDWEGQSAEEIFAKNPRILTGFFEDPINNMPPGAEPLEAFSARVLAAWQEIILSHRADRHLLLVSHGGPIRMIIAHILGIPYNRLLNLEVPLASISRIRVNIARDNAPFCSLAFHGRLP